MTVRPARVRHEMPITTDMIVRIAHADIALGMAFPRSVAHWHSGIGDAPRWQVRPGNCDALLIGKDDGIVIDGDCSNRISAPDGGVIHIYGNLCSDLDVAGHYEIVVSGDVESHAHIRADGFCNMFIGGRFAGILESTDSTKLWIGSDFDGTLHTGNPSTRVQICGDLNGEIRPGETGALLWITVAGFASNASLSKIADCGYTQFHASIAASDVPPGLYPSNGRRMKASGGNSFARWCVETRDDDRPEQ